jgi:hypothetical protein
MTEVKYDKSHHAGSTPEARITARLRNSGGLEADHVVQKMARQELSQTSITLVLPADMVPATLAR